MINYPHLKLFRDINEDTFHYVFAVSSMFGRDIAWIRNADGSVSLKKLIDLREAE